MSDIEEKQKFLRTAIVDEGYNPGEFLKFIQEERTRGINTLLWKVMT